MYVFAGKKLSRSSSQPVEPGPFDKPQHQSKLIDNNSRPLTETISDESVATESKEVQNRKYDNDSNNYGTQIGQLDGEMESGVLFWENGAQVESKEWIQLASTATPTQNTLDPLTALSDVNRSQTVSSDGSPHAIPGTLSAQHEARTEHYRAQSSYTEAHAAHLGTRSQKSRPMAHFVESPQHKRTQYVVQGAYTEITGLVVNIDESKLDKAPVEEHNPPGITSHEISRRKNGLGTTDMAGQGRCTNRQQQSVGQGTRAVQPIVTEKRQVIYCKIFA